MLWCIMLMIIADMMLITQKTAVLLYVMDICVVGVADFPFMDRYKSINRCKYYVDQL